MSELRSDLAQARAYLLDAALLYARQGLPVFPLHERSKIPFAGEHVCAAPLHQHGRTDASTDPGTVEAWWREHPRANVGLATGRGLDVLDVDGPEGEASLAELVTRRWPLPPTCEVRTGREGGGRHLYFRSAGWPSRSSKIARGLDTRGVGGSVTLPPSVHPSGARYAWTSLVPPAPAPAWLTEIILRQEERRAPATPRRPLRDVSRYATAALDSACAEVGSAPEGVRNETLNREAFGIGQLVAGGALEEGHAEDVLVSAGCAAGLSEAEARRTVRGGFRGGAAKPRTCGASS